MESGQIISGSRSRSNSFKGKKEILPNPERALKIGPPLLSKSPSKNNGTVSQPMGKDRTGSSKYNRKPKPETDNKEPKGGEDDPPQRSIRSEKTLIGRKDRNGQQDAARAAQPRPFSGKQTEAVASIQKVIPDESDIKKENVYSNDSGTINRNMERNKDFYKTRKGHSRSDNHLEKGHTKEEEVQQRKIPPQQFQSLENTQGHTTGEQGHGQFVDGQKGHANKRVLHVHENRSHKPAHNHQHEDGHHPPDHGGHHAHDHGHYQHGRRPHAQIHGGHHSHDHERHHQGHHNYQHPVHDHQHHGHDSHHLGHHHHGHDIHHPVPQYRGHDKHHHRYHTHGGTGHHWYDHHHRDHHGHSHHDHDKHPHGHHHHHQQHHSHEPGHHSHGFGHHDTLHHGHAYNRLGNHLLHTHSGSSRHLLKFGDYSRKTYSGNFCHFHGDCCSICSLDPNVALENTFKTEPEFEFKSHQIRHIIKQVMEANLKDREYDPVAMQMEARAISDLIKKEVKALHIARYKLVCLVCIGQGKSQSVQIASRCLWEQRFDNFASETVRFDDFFATGMVFATYYE